MTIASRTTRLALIGLIVSAVILALALLQYGLAAAAPTAPTAAGVIIQPAAAAKTGAPGGIVTYTLRMTNTGTSADTFSLTLLGHAWPTTFTVTGIGQTIQLPLASGAGQEVKVTVTIPLTATGSDVTVFTATSQNNGAVSAATTLTTTVNYKLYLPVVLKNSNGTLLLP